MSKPVINDGLTMAAFAMGLFATPALAQVQIEYVAHACFVIESPGGTRVVVDPYTSYRWLGYTFPESISADAVLVTHPHYDHDASYYFPRAPVFRSPGSFVVDDVRIQGFTG